MSNSAFRKLISEALKKDLFFAVYKLPDQDELNLILQKSPQIVRTEDIHPDSSGFVFHRFENSGVFIKADMIISQDDDLPESLPGVTYNLSFHPEVSKEISKDEYLSKTKDCISQMKKVEYQKVVISRLLKEKANWDREEAFFALINLYPDAFTYLVNLPGHYTWIGASPERLLSKKDNQLSTIALAGTRFEGSLPWTEKEYREQHLVVDYVVNELADLNLDFDQSDVFEVKLSSGLRHLCTSFTISGTDRSTLEIALKLHPTPAICGYPVDTAKKAIANAEQHHREFYTGFLGPLNIENTSELFVNLRCGSIFGDEFRIYVGGGITSDSDAQDEWNETQEKSKTMLALKQRMISGKIMENEHR